MELGLFTLMRMAHTKALSAENPLCFLIRPNAIPALQNISISRIRIKRQGSINHIGYISTTFSLSLILLCQSTASVLLCDLAIYEHLEHMLNYHGLVNPIRICYIHTMKIFLALLNEREYFLSSCFPLRLLDR